MACAGEGSECSPSSGSDGEFEKFLSRVKTPKSTTCCRPRTQSNNWRKDSAEDFPRYLASKYSSAKKEHTPKVPGLPGKEAACPVSSWPPLESSDPDSGDDSVFVRSRPRGGPRMRRPLARGRWTWRSSSCGGPASSSRKGPGAAARDSSGSSASEGEGGAAKEHPRGTTKSWQSRARQALLGSGRSEEEEEEEEELDSLLVRLKNRMTFPSNSAAVATTPTPHKSPAALPPPSAPRASISAQDPKKNKALVDVTQAHSKQRRSSCQIKGCFLQELSSPESQQSKRFQSEKEELAQKLYAFYNRSVFQQQLPEQMEIIWNQKMRKTAGCCITGQRKGLEEEKGKGPRYARIMLSEKVCDSADRLRDTLIHELCHAAAWLIHGVRDGHGRFWSLYAKKSVLIHPELPMVSRCHNYEIKYKFIYECSRCKNSIGRHSKSLDTQRCVCALCNGQLVLCQPKQKVGTPAKNTHTSPAPFAK